MQKQKKPKGSINIQGCQIAVEEHHNREHCFTVKAQEVDRVYHLQCSSADERVAWMEVLSAGSGVEKRVGVQAQVGGGAE